MSFMFNLAATLALLIAAAALWLVRFEVQEKPVKIWWLAVSPLLCTVVAIVLLASDPPSQAPEALRAAAAIVGLAVGVVVGNRVPIETDQMWGSARLAPSYGGVAAASVILSMALIYSATMLPDYPTSPIESNPAIVAALFAGFLDGRAWRMVVRATRARHVDLHDA
jgi:hypothetical protein